MDDARRLPAFLLTLGLDEILETGLFLDDTPVTPLFLGEIPLSGLFICEIPVSELFLDDRSLIEYQLEQVPEHDCITPRTQLPSVRTAMEAGSIPLVNGELPTTWLACTCGILRSAPLGVPLR